MVQGLLEPIHYDLFAFVLVWMIQVIWIDWSESGYDVSETVALDDVDFAVLVLPEAFYSGHKVPRIAYIVLRIACLVMRRGPFKLYKMFVYGVNIEEFLA